MPNKKTATKRGFVLQTPDTSAITKSALCRVVRRAGVKRVNVHVWDVLRDYLEVCVRNVLGEVLLTVDYFKRKTATLDDLYNVVALNGTPLMVGINKNVKTTKTLKLIRSFNVNTNVKSKRKPGKVAQQEVRRALRPENVGLVIPRKNFSNFVKGVAQETIPNIRFKEGFVAVLQMFVEQALVDLCDNASLCAAHDSNRTTMNPRDLELAAHISGRWYFQQ